MGLLVGTSLRNYAHANSGIWIQLNERLFGGLSSKFRHAHSVFDEMSVGNMGYKLRAMAI